MNSLISLIKKKGLIFLVFSLSFILPGGVEAKSISIGSSGDYIGIGTASPASTLDTNGLIKMRNATITANEDLITKSYLTSALGGVSATSLPISGYGNSSLTYYQTSSSFDGSTADWASYIIANHSDGATYYHHTIRLPFFGVPQYRRQTGSTSSVTPWYTFVTQENIANYLSGSSGYLAKFSGTSAVASSQIYDSGTNVGIGTASPQAKLDVFGYTTNNLQAVLARGASDANFRLAVYNGSGSTVSSEHAWFGLDWAGTRLAGISFVRGGGANAMMNFQTNTGSNAMSIDFSGKVGIGTTAPGDDLDLYSTADHQLTIRKNGASSLSLHAGGSPAIAFKNSAPLLFGTKTSDVGLSGWNELAQLSTAGDLGIKMNSKFVLNFSDPGAAYLTYPSSAVGAQLYSYYNVSLQTRSGTGLTVQAADGYVGIGTTTPTSRLAVVGSVTANGFVYESDRNLKKDIATIKNPLDKIQQLRGVTFKWKENNRESVGLIAQEVEKVFPELVSKTGSGKAVEYGNLVAPLIEAVKAQQKEIDSLNKRIEILEAKK